MLHSSYLVLVVNQVSWICALGFLLREGQFRAGHAECQQQLIFGGCALPRIHGELRIPGRFVAQPI
jgi:hypothetical protein